MDNKVIVLLSLLLNASAANAHQLDSEYSKEFTDLVELVYGPEFLSQGGNDSIECMFAGQDLNSKKLLDIGSGLGGVDFYLAEKYAVDVTGIDCVVRLVEDANKSKARHTLKGIATFVHQEADNFNYPFKDNFFDIVFSKEALLHVSDKESLLKELFRVAKPGGKIIILDWLVSNHDLGPQLKAMMEMDGLDLKMATFKEYQDALYAAGFNSISVSFMNRKYIGYTQNNIDYIQIHKDLLVQMLGKQNYNYSLKTWALQKSIFECNEIIVTLIKATKPH